MHPSMHQRWKALVPVLLPVATTQGLLYQSRICTPHKRSTHQRSPARCRWLNQNRIDYQPH